MTGFLDTEIAPAIKLTPKNKGPTVFKMFKTRGCDKFRTFGIIYKVNNLYLP